MFGCNAAEVLCISAKHFTVWKIKDDRGWNTCQFLFMESFLVFLSAPQIYKKLQRTRQSPEGTVQRWRNALDPSLVWKMCMKSELWLFRCLHEVTYTDVHQEYLNHFPLSSSKYFSLSILLILPAPFIKLESLFENTFFLNLS